MIYLYVLLGGAMLTGIMGLFEFVNGALMVPSASLPVQSRGVEPVDLRLLDREFLMVLSEYNTSWNGKL